MRVSLLAALVAIFLSIGKVNAFENPLAEFQQINAKKSTKKNKKYSKKIIAKNPGNELKCMAANIFREAGIESKKGKIAVANVTMNRVKLDQYPDSVCGVVYSRGSGACAFSWVCMGQSPKYDEESMQVARLALSGALKDVTNGADHYHADYVNPRWAKRSKMTSKIGRHIFYDLL